MDYQPLRSSTATPSEAAPLHSNAGLRPTSFSPKSSYGTDSQLHSHRPSYDSESAFSRTSHDPLFKGTDPSAFYAAAERQGRIICGTVTALVLTVVGVLLFFFIPRFPQIEVNNINLDNFASGAFTFSTPNDNGNLNQLRIGLNLSMDLSTFNPNIYGLQVDKLDLTAQVTVNTSYVFDPRKTSNLASAYPPLVALINKNGKPPLAANIPAGYSPSNNSQIGTATYGSIYFPPKTWINYTMIFVLDYTPDPYVGLLGDPTIKEIADICGVTSRYSPPGRPMKIHYEAKSTIPALKPIGYAPAISNDISINCPISQSQIQAVVAAVQNGEDAMTALKQVLSSPIS
ncbi:hypothetical protein HDU81_002433 [Chytriomyces hyalinus]|nr:hypothetical protein HDU81_002433 [Chytriomyces hyalinus]